MVAEQARLDPGLEVPQLVAAIAAERLAGPARAAERAVDRAAGVEAVAAVALRGQGVEHQARADLVAGGDLGRPLHVGQPAAEGAAVAGDQRTGHRIGRQLVEARPRADADRQPGGQGVGGLAIEGELLELVRAVLDIDRAWRGASQDDDVAVQRLARAGDEGAHQPLERRGAGGDQVGLVDDGIDPVGLVVGRRTHRARLEQRQGGCGVVAGVDGVADEGQGVPQPAGRHVALHGEMQFVEVVAVRLGQQHAAAEGSVAGAGVLAVGGGQGLADDAEVQGPIAVDVQLGRDAEAVAVGGVEPGPVQQHVVDIAAVVLGVADHAHGQAVGQDGQVDHPSTTPVGPPCAMPAAVSERRPSKRSSSGWRVTMCTTPPSDPEP